MDPDYRKLVDPSQSAGRWANWTQVVPSNTEVTLDFYRVVWSTSPPRDAHLVARVAMEPIGIERLMTDLAKAWTIISKPYLPPEVHGGTES